MNNSEYDKMTLATTKKKNDYSVIIPVSSESKIPLINNLITQLSNQISPPKEIHIVIGDKRQGRAINFGVDASSTKYVATLDDDTEIDDQYLFDKLISAIQADDSIGMVGAACEIPQNASKLQKRAMKQIPRRFFPTQKSNIDSDMVQHPCLLMEKDFFLKIGGEDEEIIRGLDPLLRKKVRDAGKRVVIVADTWIYHLLPNSIFKIIKMYFRNGRGSAFAKKYHPDKIYELTDGYEKSSFTYKRGLLFRIIRRIKNIILALFSLKEIRLLCDTSYTLGYIAELLSSGYPKQSLISNIRTEEKHHEHFIVYTHMVTLIDNS